MERMKNDLQIVYINFWYLLLSLVCFCVVEYLLVGENKGENMEGVEVQRNV